MIIRQTHMKYDDISSPSIDIIYYIYNHFVIIKTPSKFLQHVSRGKKEVRQNKITIQITIYL